MIPVLYLPEAEPEALLDVNSVPIHDVNDEPIYVLGDITSPRTFTSNGVGALTKAISCEVTEERNGEYELVMEYPMTGAHYEDIAERYIIKAKPNYQDDPQPFRIYRIEKAIEGVIRVYARHLSYDLSGVPVLPFKATSASAACAGLLSNAAFTAPFTINTTVTTVADFEVTEPSSVRSWFGGREGSLIDTYGGEWAYDKYTCTLKPVRGQDRGVKIRYGKNLIDLNQETEISNMWTGVLPYWKDQESGNTVRAGIINVAGNFDFRRVLCLDLTDDFEEQPTPAQLTARAQTYITANNIGVPKVSLTVDWAQTNERVDLCDTVEIVFERLGISAKAKCIRATWDVLKERYTSLEFGDAQTNIADTIVGMQEQEKKTKTSISETMLQAIANATAQITGNGGGYVVMHDGDGDGYPDELLIMDSDSVETATKVWRWNKSGLGYSSTGYNGSYGLAMTADGSIVADFITTGTLSADRINGGTITGVAINNGSGTFQVDENGNLTASSAAITGGYITLDTQNVSQGLVLKNTAGTTQTKLTASSIQRTVNGAAVLNMLNGAITANGAITLPNVYSTTNSGGGYVRVLGSGQLCRYVSSSTRYKHDITAELDDENDPLRLLELEPKQFKYNDDYLDKNDQRYGQNVLGFIAEEVAEVMPGAVDYDSEGRPEMWNVHVVVPALLGIVKYQKNEIDELRARLDRLEARFSDDGRQ